jgi:hypothetical protein
LILIPGRQFLFSYEFNLASLSFSSASFGASLPLSPVSMNFFSPSLSPVLFGLSQAMVFSNVIVCFSNRRPFAARTAKIRSDALSAKFFPKTFPHLFHMLANIF